MLPHTDTFPGTLKPFVAAGAALGLMVALGVAPADAGFTVGVMPVPGGYVQSAAAPISFGPALGADLFLGYAPPSDTEEASFTDPTGSGQSASASASFSGPAGHGTATNNATGTARLGQFGGSAFNMSPNEALFSSGATTGGWAEQFTITSPGHAGESGYFVFTVDIAGSLAATGATGSSLFEVTVFKDAANLLKNSFFDAGASDVVGTSMQYARWGVATYSHFESDSKTVADTVTFSVPFTFGTPFTVELIGKVTAGMRSSGFVDGFGTGTTDFPTGMTWGGVSGVYLDTLAPVGEFTIDSGSGVNWMDPFEPGPTGSPADLNGDGVVDGADLGLLLSAWGTPDGDVNGDGTTDGADLGLLLGDWG